MVYFRSPPRVPTREEVEACLKATDSEDRARDHLLAVAMPSMTGLRVHELVALTWGQVVSAKGTVRRRVQLRPEDTKGGVGGEIVLPEKLRWKLAKYRTWCSRRGLQVEGDAPLFTSRHKRQISVRRVQQIWRAIQVEVGIDRPYHLHSLRHWFATTLYASTKDIRLTQLAMRHQSISSTQIYAHVSQRRVERALENLF